MIGSYVRSSVTVGLRWPGYKLWEAPTYVSLPHSWQPEGVLLPHSPLPFLHIYTSHRVVGKRDSQTGMVEMLLIVRGSPVLRQWVKPSPHIILRTQKTKFAFRDKWTDRPRCFMLKNDNPEGASIGQYCSPFTSSKISSSHFTVAPHHPTKGTLSHSTPSNGTSARLELQDQIQNTSRLSHNYIQNHPCRCNTPLPLSFLLTKMSADCCLTELDLGIFSWIFQV